LRGAIALRASPTADGSDIFTASARGVTWIYSATVGMTTADDCTSNYTHLAQSTENKTAHPFSGNVVSGRECGETPPWWLC